MDRTNKQHELIEVTPKTLPKPTYAPFFTAIGTAMVFWSIVTSFILTIAGLFTFALGVTIWILNLTYEDNREDTDNEKTVS